jgi:hypothetical protein
MAPPGYHRSRYERIHRLNQSSAPSSVVVELSVKPNNQCGSGSLGIDRPVKIAGGAAAGGVCVSSVGLRGTMPAGEGTPSPNRSLDAS